MGFWMRNDAGPRGDSAGADLELPTAKASRVGVAPGATMVRPRSTGCHVLDRFAFDSDRLTASHAAVLERAAREILALLDRGAPGVRVVVTGHTDAAGSETYNLGLGARRAEATKTGLVQVLNRLRPGSAARVSIHARSKGEAEPISRDAAANRRAEICLLRHRIPTPRRPRCLRRVRLHLRIVSPPAVSIPTMLRSMRQVFGTAGIEVVVGSAARLRQPAFEELDIRCPTNPATTCCPFPCSTATLNPEHVRLFAHRQGMGQRDIAVYFVRTTLPSARGCCAHPPGRPGVVVTNVASQWTLAHEVAHVLGLAHVADTNRLMFRNTGAITNPPPDLTAEESRTLRRSRLTLPC